MATTFVARNIGVLPLCIAEPSRDLANIKLELRKLGLTEENPFYAPAVYLLWTAANGDDIRRLASVSRIKENLLASFRARLVAAGFLWGTVLDHDHWLRPAKGGSRFCDDLLVATGELVVVGRRAGEPIYVVPGDRMYR